jgi:hypothetical protein
MPNQANTPTAKGLDNPNTATAYVAALRPVHLPFEPRQNRFSKRSEGTRTKLGITQFWASLFEANETLPTAKKLTDTEIRARVHEQFPDRPAVHRLFAEGRDKITVNYYRNIYNSGRLLGKVPKEMSFRYNKSGKPVEPKRGRKLLSPQEIRDAKKEHHERYKLSEAYLNDPANQVE